MSRVLSSRTSSTHSSWSISIVLTTSSRVAAAAAAGNRVNDINAFWRSTGTFITPAFIQERKHMVLIKMSVDNDWRAVVNSRPAMLFTRSDGVDVTGASSEEIHCHHMMVTRGTCSFRPIQYSTTSMNTCDTTIPIARYRSTSSQTPEESSSSPSAGALSPLPEKNVAHRWDTKKTIYENRSVLCAISRIEPRGYIRSYDAHSTTSTCIFLKGKVTGKTVKGKVKRILYLYLKVITL